MALLIPKSFIHDVAARSNIVEVVSARVELKRAGSIYKGLCPFHSEKGASFTVTPSRNTYHCFGCGAHGDAIRFISEHDGLPFREAVEELAGTLGMQVPYEDSGLRKGRGNEAHSRDAFDEKTRARIYDVMAQAAKYFRQQLRSSERAISYLKSRHLTGEMAKHWGIGYAPPDWQGLQSIFPNYDDPILVQAGLVSLKEETNRRFDFFRDRIIFPVIDTRGRVVAFGGRVLDDSTPKYLNSPETPVFHKSEQLYGLHQGRRAIREARRAYAVEGYMDVVGLSQGGIGNAVAGLGTAFTDLQFQRLMTMTDQVVFAFDGDAAGYRAAEKAMTVCLPLLEDRMDLRFLLMPQDYDPDEFVIAHGPQAFHQLGDKAIPLGTFLLQLLKARHNELATLDDRSRFVAEAERYIGAIPTTCKLRTTLLRAVSRESDTPGAGSALIAANDTERKDNGPGPTVWRKIAKAARLAPDVLATHRESILALLDTTDTQEAQVYRFIQDLPVAAPGSVAQDSMWMLARDTLEKHLDLIITHRKAQAIQDLERRLAVGEISEEDYLREHAELLS